MVDAIPPRLPDSMYDHGIAVTTRSETIEQPPSPSTAQADFEVVVKQVSSMYGS